MKIRIFAVLFAVLVLAAGCRRETQYTIEVGGSTSVVPLVERFVEAYEEANPHITVNIQGTGSGDGIRNAGILYQIGMTSRELTPEELGRGLNEYPIAIDAIAIVLNIASAVSNLTVEQIYGIYTGIITDWAQVSGGAKTGPIAVISREEGSGTRSAFEEIAGFSGRLVAGASIQNSTGAIRASVAGNPYAIGYISLGAVDATTQAISISGAAPTAENVRNGSYAIARRFILLTGSNISEQSRAFLDWMRGPEGQEIVQASGWIPVY